MQEADGYTMVPWLNRQGSVSKCPHRGMHFVYVDEYVSEHANLRLS